MAGIPEDAALIEAMMTARHGSEDWRKNPSWIVESQRGAMAHVLALIRAHDAPTIATLTASLAEAEARAEAMHRRAQIAEGALAKANELLALADSNDGKSSRNTVRYYRKWQEAEARAGRAEAAVETKAAVDVLAERMRQIEVEGWSPDHDDEHDQGQMAGAAVCYLVEDIPHWARMEAQGCYWPWDQAWWKPADRRKNLVKAGALILAEIERLDRAALQETPHGR